MKNYIPYILIFTGAAIIIGVWYVNSRYSRETRAFSGYTLLSSSWEKYKERFINKDGRVIDYSQGDVTTSEGQSYAMLRAVWIDDKTTFDKVWEWTKDNLQKRTGDKLFGWRWGKNPSGKYGFLNDQGLNSASDADQDIALALILAGRRWGDLRYSDQAKLIIKDIWKVETDVVLGKRYVSAGNWANGSNELVINPSYFAPYAWRFFAGLDKSDDWKSLIGPAYDLLVKASREPLDKGTAVGLPPDWVMMEKTNGELKSATFNNLTTNYSYDALRVPWRVALDWQWNNDLRAKNYLSSFGKLAETYASTGKLVNTYSHDGQILASGSAESPLMYATAIGYFMVYQPQLADKIYQEKIIRLYSNDTNSFRNDIPYYEQNWLWFGVALYNHFLSKF